MNSYVKKYKIVYDGNTEYYNYQKNNWMEIACKWLEEEAAKYTDIDSEALKEAFIEVMGS